MDTVRDIASSVSVAAVIIGAVYILCPEGKTGKQMRFVAGLLMLLAVITPFAGARFEGFDISSGEQLKIDAEPMLKNQVEYLVGELLRGEDIEFNRIEALMDISSAEDISIYRICVYGVNEIEKAKALISENFPECEVEVKG